MSDDTAVKAAYETIEQTEGLPHGRLWTASHPVKGTPDDPLLPRVLAYQVGELRVEYRGTALWAIVDGAQNLNRDGRWEVEPLPSNRDAAFFDRCRYVLPDALLRARAAERKPPGRTP